MREFVDRHRWVAEIVGVISIVASLIFVGLQLEQTQQISLSEFDAQRILIATEHRSMIANHINVWAAGNAGESLDSESQEIYKLLIENEWNRHSGLSQARGRLVGQEVSGLLADFAMFLHENPGAKKTWLLREERATEARASLGMSRLSGAESNSASVMKFLELYDELEN